MKRVLFIMESYPSYRSANVLCDEAVMGELAGRGDIEIHVLASRYGNEPLLENVNGFIVHRVKKGPVWAAFTWAVMSGSNSNLAKALIGFNRVFLRMKQLVTIPIYPTYQPFFTKLLSDAAVSLQREIGFSVVVAEHNGLDSLCAGAHLKSADPSVRTVALLWDPFSGKKLAGYLPKSYAKRKMLRKEAKVLSQYDAIVALESNEAYQMEHSKDKEFFNRLSFFDIPKLVIHDTQDGDIPPDVLIEGMINIVYSGLLSLPDRDPSFIVDSLNSTQCAESVNMVFFAMGEGCRKAERLSSSFKGRLVVRPYVDVEMLRTIQSKADFLINFGGSNAVMVPSKLFDYFSVGKPIISTYIVDEDASLEYLRRYPLALSLRQNSSVAAAAAKLDDFFEKARGKSVDFETTAALFPDNTPRPYADLIQKLAHEAD